MATNTPVRQIHPVYDRTDKQLTYREQMDRFNAAMKYGFYLEAIMIDYACMEDRLRSMLYYLGVLESESDFKVTGSSKRVKCFREILHTYIDPKANMSIASITGKRDIVRSIFMMVNEDKTPSADDKQKRLLWTTLHDTERASAILHLLDEIEEWCKYRNETVHCLLNKNIDSLYEQIRQQATKGHVLFRELNNQVRWVKRKRLRGKIQLAP